MFWAGQGGDFGQYVYSQHGAGSFRDFAQKLEKAGVLRVHQGKGGWLVAPAEGVSLDTPADEGLPAPAADAPHAEPAAAQHTVLLNGLVRVLGATGVEPTR